MLFAGWEVRMVKNCDRGLGNTARGSRPRAAFSRPSKRRGKWLWVNSIFFILKLWEFARLFAAMACVNLVFPSQKLNSNGIIQRDTRGFNAAFSQNIPSVSVVQLTVQMFKLNGLGKTHRERMYNKSNYYMASARLFLNLVLFMN